MGQKYKLESAIENLYSKGEFKNYSSLEAVNFLSPINKPEKYSEFVNGKSIAEKDLREVSLFLNQPLEQITAKHITFLEEVVLNYTKELELQDEDNECYLDALYQTFEKAKGLFHYFYSKDADAYYKNYYSHHINNFEETINKINEDTINK